MTASKLITAASVFQAFEKATDANLKKFNKFITSNAFVAAVYRFYIFIIVFFISFMLILVHHIAGIFPYKTTIGRIAYYLHVIPGSLYFLISILQFSPYIRQRSIESHRLLGKIYFVLQALSIMGITAIWQGAKLEGGIGILILAPFAICYWAVTGYASYRMAVIKDIPQHQIWTIRNTAISFSIIFSRPVFVALMLMKFKNPDGTQRYNDTEMLSLAIIFCAYVFILCGEWYIYARFKKGLFARNDQEIQPTILLEKPLVTLPVTTTAPHASTPRSLLPTSNFTSMKLVSKYEYAASNTTLFRFQLLSNSNSNAIPVMNIPPTHHVTLRAVIDKTEVLRTYTPISTNFDHMNGHVDFLISKANSSLNTSFSKYFISSLEIGSDSIEILPKAYGDFYRTKQPEVLMVAVGSGITPIFSLLQSMILDSSKNANIRLVYYAKSGESQYGSIDNELPLVDEIIKYHKISSEGSFGSRLISLDIRASSTNSLTKYVSESKSITVSNSRITIDSIKQYLPDLNGAKKVVESARESWDEEIGTSACVFLCGSVNAEKELYSDLKKIGYADAMIWGFGLNGR
ncbi:NADH-cytochrome b5 reductase [Nowakowskiella sp. JEL0407]|nr:NADH-cytochrome b5 reductase [Nowakowskiella sp. JEL0407]